MTEPLLLGHRTRYVEPSLREVVGFSDVCYSGDEGAPTAVLYDSRQYSRSYAIAAYKSDWSLSGQVRCRVGYARWLDRDEQWEYDAETKWDMYLEDHWDEDEQGLPPDPPDAPPEWYEPDGHTPVWTPCKRTEKGAVRVYRCSDIDTTEAAA